MAILKVYTRNLSNEVEPKPAETCEIPDGYSFHQYLTEFVPAYDYDCDKLFSLHVDGDHWHPVRWREVLPADAVCEAVREPQGAEIIIPLVIATLSAAYTAYQMSKLDVPDNYNSTAPSSSSIYGANAQANTVRLMSPSTELMGFHQVVPDYLSAPWREYIGHEEWLHLFLRVTVGAATINSSDVVIGDTKLSALGSDASFQVLQPGASVSGIAGAEHWYTAKETEGNGVEIVPALPVFTYDSPFEVGQSTYVWNVQSNTKQLRMERYIVNSEGAMQYEGTVNWKSFFNSAGYSDTSLVGAVLILWTGSQYDYFRVVSEGDKPEFERVNVGTWDIDQSFSGFGSEGDLISGYYQIAQNATEAGDFAGWFNACPEGTTTDRLRLNFHMPEGICELDNKNVPRSHSVTVQVEYRNGSNGSVSTQSYTFSEGTLNARGYSREIAVSSGAWQVRCRVSSIGHNDASTKEAVFWNGLQAQLPSRSSYPEFTTLAVSIKGTHRLSQAASDKIKVKALRHVPMLQSVNGEISLTAPTPTRNPAAYAVYIAQQAKNPLSRLDLHELYRLQQLFDTRGDTFDGAFDQVSVAWQAMRRVMAVGLTELIVADGKIVPVRDELRDDPAWFISEDVALSDFDFNANMATSGGTDEYDGMEVEYMNPVTWKPDTVLCTLPGQTGTNPKRERAYGVTDRDRAYRRGMGILARERYRDLICSYQASLEGTRFSYLDAAELAWTLPGQSQTGVVLGKSGLTLTLSEPLTWKEGEAHVIKLRTRDGKVSEAYSVTKGATEYEAVLASDLTIDIVLTGREEPPVFMFGVADEISMRMLVKKSAISGTERAKVTLMLDSPEAYQYDDYGVA